MNNEVNQNTIQNTQVPVVPQTPVHQQPVGQQTLAQMPQQANEKINQRNSTSRL